MNKTIKRSVVISAVLTIALCASLIVGATFALFTSESQVNIAVTSGKVDVVASVENLKLRTTLTSGNLAETSATNDGNVITLDKIVPGDYVTFDIRIHNNSDVSVQYRTIITKVEDQGLWSGLEVSFDEVKFEGINAVKTDWKALAVGADDTIVKVKVALPEGAGNIYQKTSCKFAYTVEAAQGNADMPSEWDGVTKTAPTKDNEGIYHLTNAAEVVYAMEHSTPIMIGYTGNEYAFGKYVLDRSIDFGGATISGFACNDSNNFQGSFDGKGHTISNFVIDGSSRTYYAGLFGYLYGATVKDVKINNAMVIGQKQVGVIAGAVQDNSTVSGCKVYNSTVIATKKVGAVAGYTLDSTVDDCYAENCNVYCAENDENEAGEVIGYVNTGCTDENNTYENVTVVIGASSIANGVIQQGQTYLISNAAGLQWFANQVNDNNNGFNGYTVKLTADIDLNNAEWYPIGQNEGITQNMQEFFGIFDGDGHTIKNLKIKSHTPEEIRGGYSYSGDDNMVYGVGFFGWLSGAVKNVTFENVHVTGSHFVGVVAGYWQYTGDGDIIENCTVKNCTVEATHIDNTFCGDKAGGVVGMNGVANGTIKNCHVENTTITAGRDAGQVIGCAQNGTTDEGCTATNVTVTAHDSCTDEDHGANIKNDIVGRDLRD